MFFKFSRFFNLKSFKNLQKIWPRRFCKFVISKKIALKIWESRSESKFLIGFSDQFWNLLCVNWLDFLNGLWIYSREAYIFSAWFGYFTAHFKSRIWLNNVAFRRHKIIGIFLISNSSVFTSRITRKVWNPNECVEGGDNSACLRIDFSRSYALGSNVFFTTGIRDALVRFDPSSKSNQNFHAFILSFLVFFSILSHIWHSFRTWNIIFWTLLYYSRFFWDAHAYTWVGLSQNTSKAANRKARLIFVHIASRGSGRNFCRACCPTLPFLPQSGCSSTSHLSSFRCKKIKLKTL